MTELSLALIPIVMSAAMVGFYGALKYYSKSIGPNGESFDIQKFIPIVIVSVVVAIISSLSGAVTADNMVEFLGANFTLVIFVDTLLSSYIKGKTASAVAAVLPVDQLK